MPSTEIPPFTSYANSPLSDLLKKTLKDIADIKRKYQKGERSNEALKATTQVESTEILLKTLHEKIFPLFSEGKTPSIFWNLPTLISSVLSLRATKKSINAEETALIKKMGEKLTHYVEEAQKKEPPLTTSIIEMIEEDKQTLFKLAHSKTPTKGLDDILETFKTQLSALDLESFRGDTPRLTQHIMYHLNLELLTPRHPMTYELMVVMKRLLKNAPDDLSEIASFFDPKVATELLTLPVPASLLKKFTRTTRVQHLWNSEITTPSYSYRLERESLLSDEDHQTVYTETRDFSKEYLQKRNSLLNMWVMPTLHRYLALYGEKHSKTYPEAFDVIKTGINDIKSDAARAELVAQLAEHEFKAITDLYEERTKAYQLFISAAFPPIESELQTHIQTLQTFIDELKTKRKAYFSTTVSVLLNDPGKEAMLALFHKHKEQLLDVEYAKHPLPGEIQCATEGKQALPGPLVSIRNKLITTIDESIATLKAQCNDLCQKQQALGNEAGQKCLDEHFTNIFKAIGEQQLIDNLEIAANDLFLLKEQHKTLTTEMDNIQTEIRAFPTPLTADIKLKIETFKTLQKSCRLLHLQIKAAVHALDKNTAAQTENKAYEELLNKETEAIEEERTSNAARAIEISNERHALEAAHTALNDKLNAFITDIKLLENNFNEHSSELLPLVKRLEKTTHNIDTLTAQENHLKAHKERLSLLFTHIDKLNRLKNTLHQQKHTAESISQLKIDLFSLSKKVVDTLSALEDAEKNNDLLPTSLGAERASQGYYLTGIRAIQRLVDALKTTLERLSKEIAKPLQIAQQKHLISAAGNDLEHYLVKRSMRYNVKDFFSEQDRRARKAYIETLQRELRHYEQTGENAGVLQAIRDNTAKFPGIHLKSLLNKIKASLLEANEPYLANDHRDPEVLGILNHLTATKPTYADSLQLLYSKIELMRQYGLGLTKKSPKCGAEVSALAEQLKLDLHLFIINNHNTPGAVPPQEKYEAFKEQFTARLHSKNDIMHEHRNKWLQLLGNILLILFVIPQLIYSKITTGRYAFFFEKQNMKVFDAVEKQAETLTAPAC